MEHDISKTMYVIADFHNDKEVKKGICYSW